jgi:hypothetical protein
MKHAIPDADGYAFFPGHGYSQPAGGFSGAFSWWAGERSPTHAPYYVCGHVKGFADKVWRAVIDDFGDIVPIAG